MERPALTHETALRLARKLCPDTVRDISVVDGGGNNRLYKVECPDRSFALKWYPRQIEDPRDRLGTEFGALRFLASHGSTPTPRAIEVDTNAGVALYEWIDGEAIATTADDDIDRALSFAARLHVLSREDDARDLAPASEACLSAADLVAQIEGRALRLEGIAAEHRQLAEFLSKKFRPLFERATDTAGCGYATTGLDFDAPLEGPSRTLSPSDFGFHNAVRRPDGSLVFLDFEYFGWDDPVKLVADFILHPGMTLADRHRVRFCAGARAIFGSEAAYDPRLRLLFPLYALRWCMILLNEFLPERWARRRLAGRTGDMASTRATQLQKAEAAIQDLPGMIDRFPFESAEADCAASHA